MEKRFLHGVLSLFLIYMSVLFGLTAVALEWAIYALFYLGIVLAGSLLIVYFFCGKCPCRKNACGHVLPGKIACILPARKQGKYSSGDLFIAGASIVGIILSPQIFLLKYPSLLAAYWITLLLGLFEIRLFVCPGCDNKNCPGHS